MMRIAAAIAITLLSQPLYASYFTGNNLKELSENRESKKSLFSSGMLNGYITGIADFGDGVMFCISPGVTIGQLKDIVVSHINNHPELRHQPAQMLVAESISAAFPCRKGRE